MSEQPAGSVPPPGGMLRAVGDSGSSVRRRRVDLERRAELLGALEELLLTEGFTALTVDDMARRLHCSKATLYSVASSKEQLVITLTKHFFRQATEEWLRALPEKRVTTKIEGRIVAAKD